MTWWTTADRALLVWFNHLHTPWLDALMKFSTERFTWLPLYAALVGWLVWRLRHRSAWVLLALVLTVTAADQLSTRLKAGLGRARPCVDATMRNRLRLLPGYCGSTYGSVSSHAANSMGVAVLLCLAASAAPVPARERRWLQGTALLWMLLVSLSRVYLGVHYPQDILLGWLLGGALGWLAWRLVGRRVRRQAGLPNANKP